MRLFHSGPVFDDQTNEIAVQLLTEFYKDHEFFCNQARNFIYTFTCQLSMKQMDHCAIWVVLNKNRQLVVLVVVIMVFDFMVIQSSIFIALILQFKTEEKKEKR